MVKYEIKKVFSKMSSKVALLILVGVLIMACKSAMDVSYVNENGDEEYGYTAVQKLRKSQKEWNGKLDQNKIQKVIKENQRINQTPEGKSKEEKKSNIAYGWKQGISAIRDLLNCSFSSEFRGYDYYRADGLKPKDASVFYSNRLNLLVKWLNGEASEYYSTNEKAYLVNQYKSLKKPFYYDYTLGWEQLLQYASMVIMIMLIIMCYFTAGIFSNEYSWKTDAIFFTTKYGRNKAVSAKIKAGIGIVSFLYWSVMLLYSAIVLVYFGADGASCPVQVTTSGWKCFYNISIWQEYLLTIFGGYLGCLFISLLTMFISNKTRSAVLAVIFPFVLIFAPSFLNSLNITFLSKTMSVLPDRLLQVNVALKYYDLLTIGQKVTGAVLVLFVLYFVLTLLLLPVIYNGYRKQEVA